MKFKMMNPDDDSGLTKNGLLKGNKWRAATQPAGQSHRRKIELV
jgi:hypothetical protein